MALYFVPVLPDESADTVQTSIINENIADSWPINLPLPTLESNLEEVPYVHQDKHYHFVTFFSAKCKEKGNTAENEFLHLAIKRGWIPKIVKNSEEYDYKHHVDAMFKIPGGGECWVDVKCMRSLRRGWSPQSEYMWVELHSSGWLMGGKANVIAQQISEKKFALFDRVALANYVKSVVQVTKPVVPYPEQSYLRVYMRVTKGVSRSITSVLSLIKTIDAFTAAGCGILG